VFPPEVQDQDHFADDAAGNPVDNVSAFLSTAQRLGIPKASLFAAGSLMARKRAPDEEEAVLRGLFAVARRASEYGVEPPELRGAEERRIVAELDIIEREVRASAEEDLAM
jgi:hypothetical protein